MTPHVISPMLDARTGKITFEAPAITIDPSLTRDAFLGSPIAAGATTHIENEPYHSWKLDGTFRSSELDLLVVLWFHRRRLTMVSLMDSDPRFGTSWEDCTVEKEMARKESHDAWLSRSLASGRNFPWGRVWSGYDERGGFSDIVVRYGTGDRADEQPGRDEQPGPTRRLTGPLGPGPRRPGRRRLH